MIRRQRARKKQGVQQAQERNRQWNKKHGDEAELKAKEHRKDRAIRLTMREKRALKRKRLNKRRMERQSKREPNVIQWFGKDFILGFISPKKEKMFRKSKKKNDKAKV